MNAETQELKLPPDHGKRMRAAKERCRWEIGDPSWVSVIFNAYMNPESDSERLRKEEE